MSLDLVAWQVLCSRLRLRRGIHALEQDLKLFIDDVQFRTPTARNTGHAGKQKLAKEVRWRWDAVHLDDRAAV